MRKIRVVLILLLMAMFSACTQQIPNRVTSDEYAIYSAWIIHHFEKGVPEQLYLSDYTFNNQHLNGCEETMRRKDAINGRLIEQLKVLGDAAYPLDLFNSNFHIPWNFGTNWTSAKPGSSFRSISFSRVAFNRKRTEALFAVSDLCGGLCGGGDYLHAIKQDGKWTFNTTSCSWVY